MSSKHAKPSVLELYSYIRNKKASSKDCPVRFSGIPKAQLLKIALDLGYKVPAVKRVDVKRGKQVKKVANKLNKKLQKNIQQQKKKAVLSELKEIRKLREDIDNSKIKISSSNDSEKNKKKIKSINNATNAASDATKSLANAKKAVEYLTSILSTGTADEIKKAEQKKDDLQKKARIAVNKAMEVAKKARGINLK